jgi:1,2-diacylglycerol 3-alpha-glucosyltransferase
LNIAHLCLSCFYIDDFGYQENELVSCHVEAGHNVLVIASTEMYGKDMRLTYVAPSVYMGSDGAQVMRLPYRRWLPHAIMKKLRIHPGVYEILCSFRPDVILFHGLCGWELRAATKYARENSKVRFFIDSHEDKNNSARTWLSKYLLHRLYYRWIVQQCLKHVRKVLCVSLDTMDFARQMYGIPEHLLEFYPLGGYAFDDQEYLARRERGRRDAEVSSDRIMFVQTGKMGRRKRIVESLDAFAATPGDALRFVLAGAFDPEIEQQVQKRISSDPRVKFLGWRSAEQLKDLLCAADVYVQPGTQSATMQMSLCARCPVVLEDVFSHHPFVEKNGWLIRHASELQAIFTTIRDDPSMLGEMSTNSFEIAHRLLDYRSLAARLLSQ